MAMKQGRCPNCGSILTVDDRQSKAVCMFCWARFTPAEAIRIDENPGAYDFPNEEQEEPTDEERELAFKATRQVTLTTAAVQRQTPKRAKPQPGRLTPAQKVAMQKKELVVPRIQKSDRIRLIGGIGAILLVLALIFVPLTLMRESRRAKLAAEIATIAGEEIPGEAYGFSGLRNHSLILTTESELSEADVTAIYERFKAARASVYGIDANDAQANVRLRVANSQGLFEVRGGEVTLTKPQPVVTTPASTPDSTETAAGTETTDSAS
ncbi:MAG: hypothetical protein QM296_01555 [Bacillota bacterium]|nr:hypothetical protein [Bacillota bacterium]